MYDSVQKGSCMSLKIRLSYTPKLIRLLAWSTFEDEVNHKVRKKAITMGMCPTRNSFIGTPFPLVFTSLGREQTL
ncbi:hypothetical protein NPIL_439281 [Nephila pilipes]|uniref:Uncharacterized protein n=1 Tax=Nephila pilipes TaxID=299642 RepID=A0A8X6TCW6_NEPPI|nr:hypothetical protein NPIL_439281 [Nephila pilipes]